MRLRLVGVALAALVALAAILWSGARGKAVAPAARPERSEPAPVELVALASGGDSAERSEIAADRESPGAPGSAPAIEGAGPALGVGALDVRLLQPDGTPWADGELRIHAARSPIEGGHRVGFARARSKESSFAVLEVSNEQGATTSYLTDPQGRAHLAGVVAGQFFTLSAVDVLGVAGATSHEPPLAAGEQRRVELRLERFATPLRGVCLSAAGVPLPDVRVHVRCAHRYLSLACDAAGAFESQPLFGSALALTVQDPDHGTCLLDDVDPLDGPVVARLEPGRTLRVTLRDPAGRPTTTSALRARVTSDGPLAAVHPMVYGLEHVFEQLPRVPLSLSIEALWPALTREIDGQVEALEWSVPGHGVLFLLVRRLPDEVEGDWLLELTSQTWPQAAPRWAPLFNSGRQQMRFELWSGGYDLQLHFRALAGDGEPRPFGAPLHVEVHDGEETFAELGS